MKETLYSIQPANRQAFVKFLNLLAQDYKQNRAHWENDNLENFLEAIARYEKT